MGPRVYDRNEGAFRIVACEQEQYDGDPLRGRGYELLGPNGMVWHWSRQNYGEMLERRDRYNMIYELGYFDGLNHREG
jgi:hypothetical protein